MQNRRTQREEQIYESVLRLWTQRGDLHTITVQLIADEDGIGKGTIYEYFSSREEIFAKAFAYRMENEFSLLENAMKAQENVDGQLRVLLRAADRVIEMQSVGMQVLTVCLNGKNKLENLCGQMECGYSRKIEKLLEQLVHKGMEEGVFARSLKMRYAVLALLSGLSGYVSYRRTHPDELELEQETLQILYRALN